MKKKNEKNQIGLTIARLLIMFVSMIFIVELARATFNQDKQASIFELISVSAFCGFYIFILFRLILLFAETLKQKDLT